MKTTTNAPSFAVTDRMLTEAEAADVLGIRPQTLSVWRCCKRYALPYIKCGRLVRYRMSDVQRFIESRTHGAELVTA